MARPAPALATRLAAVVVLLLVPACSSTAPTAPSPDASSSSAPEGSSTPMSTNPPPDPSPRAALRFTIGDRRFAVEVGDTPPTRDLVAQLPLRLTFRDHNGLEKIAPLPRPLTTDGVPSGADPEVDDLGYYAPTGELVLYYGDVGYFEGIVRLGRIDPALSALLESGPDEVEVSLETG